MTAFGTKVEEHGRISRALEGKGRTLWPDLKELSKEMEANSGGR